MPAAPPAAPARSTVSRPARLLRVADAAARLDVSPRTLLRWIADGRVPARRLGGTYRLRAADVARLVVDGVPARAA